MIHEPKKSVSVLMPLALHQRLSSLAAYDGRTVPGEIRQILLGYLEYLDRGGVSWCSDHRNRGIEQYE